MKSDSRSLTLFDATCVVIGAIVGVGIFLAPGMAAKQAGTPTLTLLAWMGGGLIALCGALTFAELGGRYHANGAQFQVLRDVFGAMLAFVYAICNATAVQAGAMGVIALVCVDNLQVVLQASAWSGGFKLQLALLTIIGLTIANLIGVKWGAWIQNITVLAKLAALVAVIALGLWWAAPAENVASAAVKSPTASGNGLLAALVPTLFAFGGWQQALWMAGEIKNPQRNLPRAILLGVSLVILIYLATNLAYLRLLPFDQVQNSKTLAADSIASVSWIGESGRWWMALAVLISALGVLNVQLLSGPRQIQGLADNGLFFRVFAKTLGPGKTPVAAIVMLGALACLLLWIAGKDGLERLTSGVVFVDCLFFAMTGLAMIVLRYRRQPGVVSSTSASAVTAENRPSTDKPFQSPLFPLVPGLFVAGISGVLIGVLLNPESRAPMLIGMGWVVGTIILYAACFRRK